MLFRSIARILAHEINGIPYDDDSVHLDIIEIDAASNRRIDEIRDLRDKVHIAPTSSKYKVYIIDEVHMLTREAFNALLKTLEEPPAHAVFILATTDAHKLPETIVSRTQRYTFKPVPQDKVVAHLKTIAKAENITISDEALSLLAEHGEGSFRDSISMLDQVSSRGGDITVEDIRNMLGIASAQAIDELAGSLQTGASSATIMQQIDALYAQGYQAASIAKQLGEFLRSQLLASSGQAGKQQLQLLQALVDVPSAHSPERFLEISLLSQNAVSTPAVIAPVVAATVVTKAEVPKPTKKAEAEVEAAPVAPPKPAKPPEPATKQPSKAAAKTTASSSITSAVTGDELWPKILQALKLKHNTLYGVVRMAQPTFIDENNLQLNFSFAFHQKRINEPGNRQKVMDIAEELSGKPIAIECIYTKDMPAAPAVALVAVAPASTSGEAPTKDSFNAISNIFGGGELLES